MTKYEVRVEVFELAFGHDAINREFEYSEVIEQLQDFNEHSLLWDSVNEDDKEHYEKEHYEKPPLEKLAE
jgi:hypothetical protein